MAASDLPSPPRFTFWTYYTLETPPLFAVLAHGMAAVAFWRTGLLLALVGERLRKWGGLKG